MGNYLEGMRSFWPTFKWAPFGNSFALRIVSEVSLS